MQISPIGISNSYSANRKNPSFSSRFLIDVGGSVGENSLKALLIENKSNNTIFKMKDVVNKSKGFCRKRSGIFYAGFSLR